MSIEEEINARYGDPVFTAIAKCESGFNPDAKNPNSSAAGLFQIIEGTATYISEKTGLPNDRYDKDTNMEMAWWLYQQEGLAPWQHPCGTLRV